MAKTVMDRSGMGGGNIVPVSYGPPGTAAEHDLKSLPQNMETCHKMIASLLEQLAGVEQRCQHLEQRLQCLLRQRSF